MAVEAIGLWKGRVFCHNCELVLQFTKSDMREVDLTPSKIMRAVKYYISCPTCEAEICVDQIFKNR